MGKVGGRPGSFLSTRRAYGSMHGGSIDYVATTGAREARPRSMTSAFVKARVSAGLLLNRQGPSGLRAACPTPRRAQFLGIPGRRCRPGAFGNPYAPHGSRQAWALSRDTIDSIGGFTSLVRRHLEICRSR